MDERSHRRSSRQRLRRAMLAFIGAAAALSARRADGIIGHARSTIVVPIVLSAPGLGGSFFTSELTLTNRGAASATVALTYTAAFGSGSGTISVEVLPGEQRIYPDAIAFLRSEGLEIPSGGSQGGTLRISFTFLEASGDGAATVRTTTPVPGGRAGLAYAGIPLDDANAATLFVCGLRQDAVDRSNLAFLNAGTAEDGDARLRVTVFPTEPAALAPRVVAEESLAPGAFRQLGAILALAGDGVTAGYARVERVGGSAPFIAYGVINDQVNSDGSFLTPLRVSGSPAVSGLTLPAVVETPAFTTEVVVANVSDTDRTLLLAYVADAVTAPGHAATLRVALAAGEQRILRDFVQLLRDARAAGVGPRGPTHAGALFASPESGTLDGIFLGARTSTPGGGGRYGVFYPATPSNEASPDTAWIYGLQQGEESRSNLAIVNTGAVDGSVDTFRVDLFDGDTRLFAGSIDELTLEPRRWMQLGTVLAQYAPFATQGYARVTRVGGSNPFLAYGVINDGERPGERSGDGAFLAPGPRCSYTVDSWVGFSSPGGSYTVNVLAPEGCPWTVTGGDAWVSVAPASGVGDGAFTVQVGPNEASTTRETTFLVAGQIVGVSQARASRQGRWEGRSGIGSLSFKVGFSEYITSVTTNFSVSGGGCSLFGVTTGYTNSKIKDDGTFEVTASSSPSGGSASFTLRGRFSSLTAGSGTMSYTLSKGGCGPISGTTSFSVTWTGSS